MNRDWRVFPVGSVLRRSAETTVVRADADYRELTVKLWGKGVVLRQVVNGAATAGTRRFIARAGQFILSRIDARNGAFGLVPTELDGAVVSNDFPTFNTDETRLTRGYLYWFSRSRLLTEMCRRASEGTTNRVRLQEDKFLALELRLPTVDEQRRIVARIDALATKINESRKLRSHATAEGSGLAAAGVAQLFSSMKERKPIEDFAEVRGGIQKTPARLPGANPVRYLTVAHVQRNKLLLKDVRFFEVLPAELRRCRLLTGDVLIIEGNGSADQIGRTALFRGEIDDCVHQNHVIRIRPDQQQVEPEFLNSFLNSPVGQDAVQAQSRTTSGLRTLSVGRIKRIEVPVPSIVEQRRLITALAEWAGRAVVLAAVQAESAVQLDALMPAILDRAFKGEL